MTTHVMPQQASNAITTETIEPNLLTNLKIDQLQQFSTKEALLSWLDEEETRVWNELEQTLGVSKELCLSRKAALHDTYEQGAKQLQKNSAELPPLAPATVELVKNVLHDFNISEDSIAILPFADSYPASADDYSVFINEEFFNMLSPLAQKFCIGHELQHFLFKDDSTSHVLEQVTTPEMEESFEHPISQLSRIQELKADLYAAFGGAEYTRGYNEFFKIALEVIGDHKVPTHPMNSLRLTYAQHLATLNI